MSSVLDRSALEESPLADLHAIAGEIGIDGFRRLRKDDLVAAILAKQAGEELPAVDAEPSSGDEEPRPRRSRSRGGRSSRARRDEDPEAATAEAEEAAASAGDPDEEDEAAGRRNRRSRRGRGPRDESDDRAVEGVVELQGNGSAFVRLKHPEASDDDVYVSAAQVKRCELVTGDRVGGPVRPPRRSERYASLIRIDTINGRPADEVAEGTRFEDLPAVFPTTRFELDDKDATVKAVTWLTPFGRGSRVMVTGGPRSGKTELLRRLATGLAAVEDLEVSVVLAGARPEEIGEWTEPAPAAALTFAAAAEAQAQAIEQVVDQGRRVAARGGHAVVVIDSLDYVTPQAARRAMAAARCIKDGGSLTIIASSVATVGGETTTIALDAGLTALGRFPAIDLARSGTLRPELLVKAAGAKKIAKARAEAEA